MSRCVLATSLVAVVSLAQAQNAPPQTYSGLGSDSMSRETIAKYAPTPSTPP